MIGLVCTFVSYITRAQVSHYVISMVLLYYITVLINREISQVVKAHIATGMNAIRVLTKSDIIL